MRSLGIIHEILYNKITDHPLDYMLGEMSQFGKVTLGQYVTNDSSWHCSVKMFVVGQGISFEVKSSFDHLTPVSAVKECMQRLYEAMSKL